MNFNNMYGGCTSRNTMLAGIPTIPTFTGALTNTYRGYPYTNSMYVESMKTGNVISFNGFTQERNHDMSFVGLTICTDGIVAFGDSKSSRFDELGNLCEDKLRTKPVQKVFKCENYILTTCGSNQLLLNGIVINVEDWINNHIELFDNPFDMLSEMYTQLVNNNSINANVYRFFIGQKDKKGYYTQSADIMNGQFLISNKWYQNTRLNNAAFYSTHAQDWNFMHLAMNDSVAQIRDRFEGLIKAADKIGTYNPVGLPVVIEGFK